MAVVDGKRTISDEVLDAVAERMHKEDLYKTVFYDGRIYTDHAFKEYISSPRNVAVFVFNGDECIAFGWLNGITDGKAFAHFCTFRSARGLSKRAGDLVMAYWFWAFEFDVILGVISAENRLALRFVRQIGFKTVGEVPGLITDAYRKQRLPGVITYCAR